MNPVTIQRTLSALALTTLLGAGVLSTGSARAADEKFAWKQPFELQLPETVRTISLKPRTDVAEFTATHGLSGARAVPMGRGSQSLEIPMDDSAWEAMQESVCTDPAVAGCESAVCQGIQFSGSAEPGSQNSAETIQARLVKNPPESVPMPDPENPEAGSCRGAPLVPALDQAGTVGAGQDLTLDLTLLDTGGGKRVKGSQAASTEFDPSAPDAGGLDPAGLDVDLGESPAQTAADSVPGAVAKQSFQFAVNTLFNPSGGMDLGSSELPADTSDWTLVVGAGCSEVKVPLNALEPARLPGIVVALVDAGDVAAVAGSYGLTVLNQQPLTSTGQNLVTYATSQNVFTVLAAIALDARVDGAQPEYVFETTADAGRPVTAAAPRIYSDPFAAMNYAPAMTGALALHGNASGNGQLIAVIDTGIDVAHPDLAGRLREPVDTTDRGYAAETHGTAVAGIIAAEADNAIGSYGVAPAAEILPIKACQPKEEGGLKARCTTSTLVRALDVAITEDAAIINMSLAGPPDDLVARYVNLALQQGRLVVAGAGNGGAHAKPGFPAAIPGVLAVTAVDVADGLYSQANRGDYIDVAAPGVDIVSTVPDGQYPPLSGTSMAAAHVSGIAALIRELGPLLSAREVAMIIKTNTRDLGAAGDDAEFGSGLVDACQAASAATADAVSCNHGGENADLSAD